MLWECDHLCRKKCFRGHHRKKQTSAESKVETIHILPWYWDDTLLYVLDCIFKYGCIRSTVIPSLRIQLSFNTYSPARRSGHASKPMIYTITIEKTLFLLSGELRFSKKLTRNRYLANPRKTTRCCTHFKSCRLQLETGWVTSGEQPVVRPPTSSFLCVYFKACLASFRSPDGNKESNPCRSSSTADRCTETLIKGVFQGKARFWR